MLHFPILAGNSRSTGISQLRAGKTRSKKFYPPFQRYSESWVQKDSVSTCLKKNSVENFWVWSDLRKISVFNEFAKKIRWPAADSILMPPTFPIANLNRYTPQFSGEPHKLTWYQQFGLQIFPKWGGADFLLQKNAVFSFFGLNKFSRPNVDFCL